MSDKVGLGIYKGRFDKFDAEKLTALANYITLKSSFSEELPMVVLACGDDKNASLIESYLSSIIAVCGGHAVKLGRLNKKIYIFAIKFLSADNGLYISCTENGGFTIECTDSTGGAIDNLETELKAFDTPLAFRPGKISGYTEIIEKYIKLG